MGNSLRYPIPKWSSGYIRMLNIFSALKIFHWLSCLLEWLHASLFLSIYSASSVLNPLLIQLQQTQNMVVLYLLSSSHLLLSLKNSIYLANSSVVCKVRVKYVYQYQGSFLVGNPIKWCMSLKLPPINMKKNTLASQNYSGEKLLFY